LSGLATTTLKTNGVVALSGMTWTPKYAGTALNFTNSLPLEFGFQNDGALGATATTGNRGPILDNYRVEVGVAADVTPPVVQINTPTNGSSFLLYAPVTVSATVTDNVAVAEVFFSVDGGLVASLTDPPFEFVAPPLMPGVHTLTVVGADDAGNTATNNVSVTVVFPPPGPLSGVPVQIPNRIEAEDFDVGGPGFGYSDTTVANQGGTYFRSLEAVDIEETQDVDGNYDVGWIQNGEWLQFTANVTGGYQDISARVASLNAAPGDLRVSLNGTVLGTFDVTNTGAWQEWVTLTLTNVPLVSATNQLLRLEAVNGGAGNQFNVNWVEFAPSANVSGPHLTTTITGNQLVINWPTVSGWRYQVEASTNLTSGIWSPTGALQTAAGSSLSFTNLIGGGQQFFRIQETP